MPVRFLCPACHQLLSIASRKVGSEVDCPKSRSTIIVPDPHNDPATEPSNPFEHAGLEEALSAISIRETPAPKTAPPSNSLPATPLLHQPPSISPKTSGDDSFVVISRRVLYLQAALLALVAIVAFVCGYVIGSGIEWAVAPSWSVFLEGNYFNFGNTDVPFAGDWTGSGRTGIGVFRTANGLTFERNDATTNGFADNTFVFGNANDAPLAGHWVSGPVSAPPPATAPTLPPTPFVQDRSRENFT